MNDMNRLLIFLLLAGLLFSLYKYQHLIFGGYRTLSGNSNSNSNSNNSNSNNNIIEQNKAQMARKLQLQAQSKQNKIKYQQKQITVDNISQLSFGSLDDEN